MGIGGFFKKLASGFSKTAAILGGGLRKLFGRKVDQDFLNDLEAILLRADVGVSATDAIIASVKQSFADKEAGADLLDFVKNQLKGMLQQGEHTLAQAAAGPTILMVVGVNGSGKTTSIAKLANFLVKGGRKVLVGASDTFRAAASEQLAVWAGRVGADIVRGQAGSDPSAVAHDACTAAVARQTDLAIVDTAGRQHTHSHLMRELQKIHRVIGKVIPEAPHEVLLVLDANNGQNAIRQAVEFTKAVQCTGIVLAKMDGTAKGGFVVAIQKELGIPVKFIGVGEGIDDLEAFDADAFIEGLFADAGK